VVETGVFLCRRKRGIMTELIDYSKPILDEDGNPIKISEIGDHHCIRCIKKARALKKVGYTIYGAGHRASYGTDIYDAYFVFHNDEQMENTVKAMIDLGVRGITWNNEPDSPAIKIKNVIKSMGVEDKVKLIVDLHDLDSVRRGFIPLPEREMFNTADAFIFVSNSIKKVEVELHKIDKPSITLFSYCNKGVIDYDPNAIVARQGLVYEGGANTPVETSPGYNTMFRYRLLHPLIKRLVELGNVVYMYCGNITAYDTYHDTGAVLFPPTDYDEMMKGLIKYKYGILGFNNEDGQQAQVNLTLTNKMMEYLQAGLPSLAFWCKESEDYVRKHNIGFTFEHIDDIGDTSHFESMYPQIMSNIWTKRQELVMENFIWRVENLYAELLGLNKKGVPDNIMSLSKFEFDDID